MALLMDLASELLYEIIGLLDSLKDLTALALSCRRLHTLVDIDNRRPYHHVHVGDGVERTCCPTHPTPHKIREQLSHCPRVSFYVQELTLDICAYDTWGRSASPPSIDREAALLVAQLPNLVRLRLENSAGPCITDLLDKINSTGTYDGRKNVLQNLREIYIDGHFEPGLVLALRKLPSIEECTLGFNNGWEIGHHYYPEPEWGTSKVRRLHVKGFIPGRELVGVIRLSKSLVELTCDLRSDYLWETDFEKTEFEDALLIHSFTLRGLALGNISGRDGCGSPPGIISCLNRMIGLKNLSIQLEKLLPLRSVNQTPPTKEFIEEFKLAERLPPNLEILDTWWSCGSTISCRGIYYWKVREFLEEKESSHPSLKKITGLDDFCEEFRNIRIGFLETIRETMDGAIDREVIDVGSDLFDKGNVERLDELIFRYQPAWLW